MPTSQPSPLSSSLAAVAAVVAVALALSGCAETTDAARARTPRGKVVLPAGSTEPFDAIRGDLLKQFDDTLRAWDYRCAAAAGFTPLPISNVREPFHELKFTESDFGTVDVDVARRDGLLAGGALIDPGKEAPRQTEATAAAIGKCDVQARKQLGSELIAAYDDYVTLANDMASQYFAKMSSQYQPYRLRLYSCVETKGWHADDVQALSRDADIRKHYDVVTAQPSVNEATGKESYLPTPKEVSLAVALAECRKTTGYSRDVFQRSRQVQDVIVGNNEAKLAEANTVLERAVAAAAGKLR
jgi:hypothetical protein